MKQKNKLFDWFKKVKKDKNQEQDIDTDINKKEKDTKNKIDFSASTTSKKRPSSKEKSDQEDIKVELYLEEDASIEVENEDITKNIIINDITIKNDTLAEIEKMLRSDRYEIEHINYELNVIKKDEQDEQNIKEIEDLIERLNDLIKRFEKIKKDFFTKYYDEININTSSDNYVKHLIDEYKLAIKNDNIKDANILEIKQIEEYISLINTIIEIENEASKLEENLEDKKENIIGSNKEFDKLSENYSDIDNINDYIDKFAKEQSYILNDIEKKVDNQEAITKSVEYQSEIVTNYNKLFLSILTMAAAGLIPPTKNGNILASSMIIGAIAGIATSRKSVMKEKKVTTNINYIDYEKEILNSINSIDDISLTIDKTLLDIKQLKKEFEHDFKEYAHSIPEFYSMIANLDSIEKDLEVKNQIMKDFDKKLGNLKKTNNNKVKKIEIDYPK